MLHFMTRLYSQAIEGSGGGETASAPAPEPSRAETLGMNADVERILAFDPFEAGNKPAPSTPTAEPEPAPVETAPETPTLPPPVEPALTQTVQALQETVQALPQAVKAAVAQPPQPQQPAPDEWFPRDGENQLNYQQVMGQLPDQLINMLWSENPAERKMAVAQALGIGMHVAHRLAVKQAVEHVRNEMSRVLPLFVGEQLRTYSTMSAVFNDFYGRYPQLNSPALRPLVQREAMALAQREGVSEWSEQFRERLAQHVFSMLKGVVPQSAPPVAPTQQTMGPSARPGMGMRPNNVGQDIMDLFG